MKPLDNHCQLTNSGRVEARLLRRSRASHSSRFLGLLMSWGVWASLPLAGGGPSWAAEPSGLGAAANAVTDGLIASPEPGWPQWRGPRRDGVSGETDLLPTWPETGPRQLWKVDGLGKGWSSPIVVDGRLYVTGDVGDDLVVFAFDLGGKLLWQATNGASWQGSFVQCFGSATAFARWA